ncbi:glycosyltransferase [Hyunsoonleella pacifica]|uniref:Glycosyltransferase n=1 Tax=Hyunsoonleella pacifica TaxID=1080224 RepID=A0A4Q9FRV3_9FLAO|nr:glycosyltransferase [Hyunsoonleella pacifica]TBN18526.1 glycosyltransferase [Hyunsoonleella pacifica]GGD02528.1 glycosyl transferase [Hyunsoonleella pacifica]
MRVLQLIDSLQTGGAERVAVNLANILHSEVDQTFLCATRQGGLLKQSLSPEVGYLFLNKRFTLDTKAIFKLHRFVKHNRVDIIHAHSTSFFLAILVKVLNKKVKIVWHDHYGKSEFLKERNYDVLKYCSNLFSHVFCVNRLLEVWAKKNLKSVSVSYLQNFLVENVMSPTTTLNGVDGKRIVHLANLRSQKDHISLLRAFKTVVLKHPDWTLHCLGKDFMNGYSNEVKSEIDRLNLNESVFLYGSCSDVFHVLRKCQIGVLSSKSEGLPLALLEYGSQGLPVVATNVGNCKDVILNSSYGQLIEPMDVEQLQNALSYFIENPDKQKESGTKLKQHIRMNFSEKAVRKKVLEQYKLILYSK